MKLSRSCLLGVTLFLAAGSVWAFNFGDALKLANEAGVGSTQQGSAGNANALALISALNGLNVTPQQALGGTGALLSVAREQMPGNDYANLLKEVPQVQQLTGNSALNQLSSLSGLLGGAAGPQVSDTAQSALGNVETMADARQAFSALGMDSGLVAQFTPILLQYLDSQGANGGLLQSLASAWGASAQ